MRFACSIILAACCAVCAFLFGCSISPEDGETGFYGLIVGISDYAYLPYQGVSDLNYCDDDAMKLREALTARGWSSGEITLLTDVDATKASITGAISSILNSAGEKDYVLVYYSGHGTIVPDTNGDEADGFDEAIVPADYDPVSGSPLILDDELLDLFRNARTEKGLIIFDSCNSGGVINRGLEIRDAAGSRGAGPNGVSPRTFPWAGAGARDLGGQGANGDLDILNFPVLAASGQDEPAFEDSSLSHGVFTYFILGGLERSGADTSGDGKVSVRELFAYAKIHTESYTEAQLWSQHPQIRFARDFVDILVTR